MSDIESARLVLMQTLPGPVHDELLRMYTLLLIVKGRFTTPRDVHDAWRAWQMRSSASGAALVSFDALGAGTRELDVPYVEAIHRAAEMLAVPR